MVSCGLPMGGGVASVGKCCQALILEAAGRKRTACPKTVGRWAGDSIELIASHLVSRTWAPARSKGILGLLLAVSGSVGQ